MRRQGSLYLLAIILVALGCSESMPTAVDVNLKASPKALAHEPPLVQHIISPKATDPHIDVALEDHLVWLDPTQQPHPRLFVFFHSASSRPANVQLVPMEAARLGYHVISLRHPSGPPGVGAICTQFTDREELESCYENIRLQTLDGVVRSDLISVNPPNSIYNRLTKLLEYLAAHFPEEGWSQFLTDGAPLWSHIAVAGISAGGGYAALIAKLHEVARVVMISSPTDGLIDLDDGARMVEIGATPPDRHYGLAHQQEFPIRPIRANWNKLGLDVFGPPVVPETSAPPYSGTHMLLTNLPPSRGVLDPNSAHCLTANDRCTPLAADGTPALRDAWRYISGQPGK